MNAHAFLRAQTRAAHDRLDARFSALNLGDLDDYRAFLLAQAAAFLPVEQALTDHGAESLLPDWPAVRRSDALLADLRAVGLAVPPPEAAPPYATRPELLGGLYVIEGSRLGGKVLQKSIGPGFPARFLRSTPPPGHWRAFLAMLDRIISTNGDREDAAKSAIRTFERFESATRRVLNQ